MRLVCILITCVLMLISGCQSPITSVAIEADEFPPFIVDIAYHPDSEPILDDMCVRINQGELWVQGDEASSLFDYLRANTTIMIDGALVSHRKLHFSQTLTLRTVYEGEEAIGTYGGDMFVCFDIEYLNSGFHESTIQILSTANEAFDYSWGFEIYR